MLNRVLARKFMPGKRQTRSINQFFFPQDAISNWNIAFGRRGFVEYHCCIPLAQSRAAFTELHAFLCAERMLCALVTLKRFGLDPELLDRATALGRVLVTMDEDFLAEATRRQRVGVRFAGVIYAHQLEVTLGRFIDDLELICAAGGEG